MVLFEFNSNKVENLIRLARNMINLSVVILCEGTDDIKTLKSLIRKLDIKLSRNVGVSDCGGITKLKEFAPIVSMICRLSKRTEKIVLIVDSNTRTPRQTINSLGQSLESHNVVIENLQRFSNSIYTGTYERFDFLIKAVGKRDLPFKSHEMEDYAVHLLIIKGEIQESQLTGFLKASDFIEELGKKGDAIIEESEETDVSQAYENVITLLTALLQAQSRAN